MKFHITTIAPSNYRHWQVFGEQVKLVANSLNDLGHTVSYKPNRFEAESINILFGSHLLLKSKTVPTESLNGYNIVAYQLEQLVPGEEASPYLDLLRSMLCVWDYSDKNVAILNQHGITATNAILGFHPGSIITECETTPFEQQDIDVLLLGMHNPRRHEIIKKLEMQGACALQVYGKYGEEKIEFIRRAKSFINIHYYDTALFPQARSHSLLASGKFIVSEPSADNPYLNIDLKIVPYEELLNTCLGYIQSEKAMSEIAKLNQEQFREHYPMTDILEKAIEVTL